MVLTYNERKEMNWMAEALHRFIENERKRWAGWQRRCIGPWGTGWQRRCIGSKDKKKRNVVGSQNVDQIARRCKVHT